MAELLRSLQDSQLVARFQRRCGLFPAPDEGPRENGAGPAEGAALAPGAGHHPATSRKGAEGPANGLRRAGAPQVTAGQVPMREGGRRGSPLRGLRTSWSRRLRDAGTRVRRACRAEGGSIPSSSPAPRAVCVCGGGHGGWGVRSPGCHPVSLPGGSQGYPGFTCAPSFKCSLFLPS